VQTRKISAWLGEHLCERTNEESLTLILEAMDDFSQKSSVQTFGASTIEVVGAGETVTTEMRVGGFP